MNECHYREFAVVPVAVYNAVNAQFKARKYNRVRNMTMKLQ